ncbi:Bbp19 family protein [Sphingomonas parapaucimobilis]|nr:hypothetical protein [Sphingomonas parapaucimobilis]
MVQRAYTYLARKIALLRSQHYKRLFLGSDNVMSRDAEIVLADLRDFCRAEQGAFSPDPYVNARNLGRREVFLRLTHHLNLDEAEVRKLMEMDSGLS